VGGFFHWPDYRSMVECSQNRNTAIFLRVGQVMSKKAIRLANSVHWNRERGDKVYLDGLHHAVTDFPFTLRQVILRFNDGPAIDLSIYDMDRIAIEYLRQRGIKRPAHILKLPTSKVPPACDFLVPAAMLPKKERSASRRSRRT
jgi:hypothetical protein